MSQAPYKRLILANSTFLKFDLPYFIPPIAQKRQPSLLQNLPFRPQGIRGGVGVGGGGAFFDLDLNLSLVLNVLSLSA